MQHPERRLRLQPSFVLAALALSTLMKSSEMGLGPQGRSFALWLKDAAQSAFEASLAVNWMEPTLAHAAYVSQSPSFEALWLNRTLVPSDIRIEFPMYMDSTGDDIQPQFVR